MAPFHRLRAKPEIGISSHGRVAGRRSFAFTSPTLFNTLLPIAAVSSGVSGVSGWRCASNKISAWLMRPICSHRCQHPTHLLLDVRVA
jgi:hypothetical protein